MPAQVRIVDATVSGGTTQELLYEVDLGRMTLRKLIEIRSRNEVERPDAGGPEVFVGLAQPEGPEAGDSGYPLPVRREIDADARIKRAVKAFQRGAFLVLVDGRQVTKLDAPLEITYHSEVMFVKLLPVTGG
ncbi:MAG: hypothetical protein K2X35_15335 [Bryobacteraceae bacterium]|nr:hypothetical protein [Bryobacteraceae bacterium]